MHLYGARRGELRLRASCRLESANRRGAGDITSDEIKSARILDGRVTHCEGVHAPDQPTKEIPAGPPEANPRTQLGEHYEVVVDEDARHHDPGIVVCKLDRLSDTLHMLKFVRDIGAKGAGFKSLAEPWCDTTTAADELMLTVFAGVAQFERKRLKERQLEGIVLAKAKGVFKGGKVRFDPAIILQKRTEGMTPIQIARHLGCNPATVFRALRHQPTGPRPMSANGG